MIENQLALVEGVLPLMQANVSITPEAAVTTLYVGHHTVGVEPVEFPGLDAIISFDALFFLDEPTEDERVVLRARRLHGFFTQPFMITEPWTAIPGESVPLTETLKGVREIFAGQHDEVPEQVFNMARMMQQVLQKANSSA